jgi:hypothetical protein
MASTTNKIKVLVSRYNNKQLTIYSNYATLTEEPLATIIPFLNDNNNQEPTILETDMYDYNIFNSVDSCFHTGGNERWLSRTTLFNYMFGNDNKSKKCTTNTTNKYQDSYYLPITYSNYYKYSIAKNFDELKRINQNEFKMEWPSAATTTDTTNNSIKLGYIIISNMTTTQTPPFAFLSNIYNNKLFIPINFLANGNISDTTRTTSKTTTTIKENLDESHNIRRGSLPVIKKTLFNSSLTLLSKYTSLRNNSSLQKQTFAKSAKITNYTFGEKNSSTDSNHSNDSLESDEIINCDIYVLHTSEKHIKNAFYAFNANSDNCSFRKYLKPCSPNNMIKLHLNKKNDENLWFNIHNNVDGFLI